MIAASFIMPHPPIILPEVGRGEEHKIQKTIDACRAIAHRIASLKPETIVVTSPHSILYADYFHVSPGSRAQGSMARFGAPNAAIDAEYDIELVAAICKEAEKSGIPAGTLGEKDPALDHGTVIPLRFVNEQYSNYRLVRIGLSGLSPQEHYRFGQCVAQAVEETGRRTVLIASGDLSHKLRQDGPYGFAAQGPQFDEEVTQAMARGDFQQFLSYSEEFCNAAAECGLRSFQVMAGALADLKVESELLSYEGITGVGYGVAAFTPKEPDEFVSLARDSLETFVRTGKRAPLPKELSRELTERRAGVFVSLKKNGQLRGCIGTIQAVTTSIAEEILRNAVSAGSEDPRFDPVRADELDSLTYSVDVLGDPEPTEITGLDPVRYGVIVTRGYRRGLLLPNLEGVDTVEQQLSIARTKAGIRPQEPCVLERFQVVRHK